MTEVRAPVATPRALLVVVLLVGLAMVLPDRHGVSTLAETNTGVRVWAVQSWVHYDTWSLDPMLCRLHPNYTPLDLSLKDGSPELQKAPGLSWLAVPVYSVMSAARGGERIPTHRAATALAVVCIWLPILMLAWVFGRWLLTLYEPEVALTALVALLGASPLFVYGTLFMDYGLATMLLVGGALAIRSRSGWWVAAGGVALGYAGDVNYMCWVHGAAIGAVELARRRQIGADLGPWLRAILGGVALPLIALLVYSQIQWGSPWATGYDFMDHEIHRGRAASETPLEMLVRALFGDSKHGMWIHAPWTMAGMLGLGLAARGGGERRWPAITGLTVLVACLAFTSFWQAEFKDDAAFARHMLPAYPWLALGLAETLSRIGGLARRRALPLQGLILGGILAGAFFATATAWTFPYHPLSLEAPLWQINVKFFFLSAHIPVIGSSLDGSAPGAARGHWIPVAIGCLAFLSALVLARRSGREGFGSGSVRAAAMAVVTAGLFFALCFQMQPLRDMERLSALEQSPNAARTESDRALLAAAANEDLWVRRLAREIFESHITPDDATWSEAGYPATSPWCRP